MGPLGKLESALDVVLDKKAPFKLPQSTRKSLASAMWWIALIVGVLDVWAAYTFWHWGHIANQFVDVVNYYTGGTYGHHLGFFYYTSLVAIALVAALLLLAVPGLKAMKKSGWNLMFYAALVEVIVAIARIFSDIGGGFGNFLSSAIGAVIGAYLLFQVRDYFVGAKAGRQVTPPANNIPPQK
jgi:hypothetical protein